MSTTDQDTITLERPVVAKVQEADHRFARQAEELALAGRDDQALELLREGIELFPDYATAHQVMADILAKRNENISATFAYFEALKRDPDNPLTMMKLGDLFASVGQIDEARKQWFDALKLEPDSEALSDRLGVTDVHDDENGGCIMTETAADVYFQQGHNDKACQILVHLLQLSPQDEHLRGKLKSYGATLK